MPPIPGSVMQEWKPAELRRALMRAVAVGPERNYVPRFPLARLHQSVYRNTRADLLKFYKESRSFNFYPEDHRLEQVLDQVFVDETHKCAKRSRGFVGVFAEFIPPELIEFMRDRQYIPPGMFHWAKEIGLRPMTQCDALHLPLVLPRKSPWYGEFPNRQTIVPMFIPTPAKSSALTAWHADRLAAMLRVQPPEFPQGQKSRLEGTRAEHITSDLRRPDTIMVFWA